MTGKNRLENARAEASLGDDALRASEALLALGLANDAVSRAYYAAFHYARALLLALGEEPRTHGGLHRLVMRDLVRTGELEPEMGEILSQLQSFRLEADYGAEFVFTSTKATEEVSNSRRFVATARQWLERGGWIAA